MTCIELKKADYTQIIQHWCIPAQVLFQSFLKLIFLRTIGTHIYSYRYIVPKSIIPNSETTFGVIVANVLSPCYQGGVRWNPPPPPLLLHLSGKNINRSRQLRTSYSFISTVYSTSVYRYGVS